jgi:hypothetical protein
VKAAGVGLGQGAVLKDAVIAEVNEMPAPVRARRAEWAWEPGYMRRVPRDANERPNASGACLVRGLFACGNTSAGQGWRNGIL